MTVYKVTSTTGFRGHREGETFEADLTADQERRAKERGSIRVIRRDKHDKEDDTDA
jgi:hypothetical protein